MSRLLHKTIVDVSTISERALSIAERLVVMASTTEEKDATLPLLNQIKQLREQLEKTQKELEVYKERDAKVFSDVEITNFRTALSKSLKDMPTPLIQSVYGASYFYNNQYTSEINKIISTELANEFQSRKLDPLPIWQELIARNGALL